MLRKILSFLFIFIYADAQDLVCRDFSSPKALNFCFERATKIYTEGKETEALQLIDDTCNKGSAEACKLLIETNLQENKISEALKYFAQYFKTRDVDQIFRFMIENPLYNVLFSDEKIPEILDYGNKYFFCPNGGRFPDYNSFKYDVEYSWHKKTNRFFPNLNSEDLSVNGYLAYYMNLNLNRVLQYASDMAQSENTAVKRLGLKLAAVIYSGCDFNEAATKYSIGMAKELAKRARELGSKADFLEEIEATGKFPQEYCFR